MSLNDPLANALSAIKNAEKKGKSELNVTPSSKVIKAILDILKKEKYIENYKYLENNRGGILTVNLKGHINNIGPIKPRYPVRLEELERFETRYLPSRNFGKLILSTSKGIMNHDEAKKQKLGGVLLAYVY
jgi:small subunit ribosomal protein S8